MNIAVKVFEPAAEVRAESGVVRLFTASLEVLVRRCRHSDLPMLEYYEEDGFHHEIIQATFEGQARGESIMLVAEVNGVVCGQVWLDLTRLGLDATGVIWAVHVLPHLRNSGIGTGLIAAAEEILRDHRFRYAELSVEKGNKRAACLYERLGYRRIRTQLCSGGTVTSDPVPVLVPANQWLMRKPL